MMLKLYNAILIPRTGSFLIFLGSFWDSHAMYFPFPQHREFLIFSQNK